MGVSITTVEALRVARHDTVHLSGEGLIRLPDPEIAAKAARLRASSYFACGIKRLPPSTFSRDRRLWGGTGGRRDRYGRGRRVPRAPPALAQMARQPGSIRRLIR